MAPLWIRTATPIPAPSHWPLPIISMQSEASTRGQVRVMQRRTGYKGIGNHPLIRDFTYPARETTVKITVWMLPWNNKNTDVHGVYPCFFVTLQPARLVCIQRGKQIFQQTEIIQTLKKWQQHNTITTVPTTDQDFTTTHHQGMHVDGRSWTKWWKSLWLSLHWQLSGWFAGCTATDPALPFPLLSTADTVRGQWIFRGVDSFYLWKNLLKFRVAGCWQWGQNYRLFTAKVYFSFAVTFNILH